jgi:hypothetical protein
MPKQIPDHRERGDQKHTHGHPAADTVSGTALPTFLISAHSFIDLLAIAPIFRRKAP